MSQIDLPLESSSVRRLQLDYFLIKAVAFPLIMGLLMVK